jgi:acyl-coenzyme A thioesterase PaaI-like protein
VTAKIGLLRATGTIIHLGARMATAEGRLVGPDGKLYAHASTTCFIFDVP